MKRTTRDRAGWGWARPAAAILGMLAIGLLCARFERARAAVPVSSVVLRSVADLQSLQALFGDSSAHDTLMGTCATHALWSVETTTDGTLGPAACDGGSSGEGPIPERLRHAFTFVREPGVSSRAFEIVYSTCSVNAEGHRVAPVSQGFRTRREIPSESVAADTVSFRVFCAGIQDPQVAGYLVDTLRNQSIAASRVELLERDGSEQIYVLSFLVRDPFDGSESVALRFLARYIAGPDGHVLFSRD